VTRTRGRDPVEDPFRNQCSAPVYPNS
jgi:hypothetical protein